MESTETNVKHAVRRPAPVAAALLLYLVAMNARPASAQEKKDYALLYGTVWSADNRAMAGVPIKIDRVGDKKPKWQLVSDRRGEFAQRVPQGRNDYVVTAEVKVAKGETKPQAKVHVENNERVDFSLHLVK